MPIVYDIKSDIRYQQGVKAGLKQYREQKTNDYVIFLIINLILKTDLTNKKLTNKKIAKIVVCKMPFVTKWAKVLTKYEVRAIWDGFKITDEDKKLIGKRAMATAKKLIRINGLSDEIISKVCELKKTKIAQIRLAKKKKLANKNGEKSK